MRAWLSLSVFGLGVVGALLLVSFASVYGYLAAVLWGFVVFPHGAAYFNRRWRGRTLGRDHDDPPTDYWRIDGWRSGHP